MLPILSAAAAADGEVNLADVREKLASQFKLSDDERHQLLPKGKLTFANRVDWAKAFLVKAGLLEATRRAHFQITQRGREELAKKPQRIDRSFLSRLKSPGFEEFQRGGRDELDLQDQPASVLPESRQTPDEVLRATHREIEKALQAELLDRLWNAPPSFFEEVTVSLLLAMGYGGSREDEDRGRHIGKPGDGGVDGVIDQDPLGLDQIYIQAKRYKRDSPVSAPDVSGFAGALESKKATKGVFITLSYFTAPAKDLLRSFSRHIILIDGDHLTRLMIRYGIGVRIEETFDLKKIDEDFFTIDP
jgi:restriction system protein